MVDFVLPNPVKVVLGNHGGSLVVLGLFCVAALITLAESDGGVMRGHAIQGSAVNQSPVRRNMASPGVPQQSGQQWGVQPMMG